MHSDKTNYKQVLFFHLIYYPRTLLSRSLPLVTQIRGHRAGPLLPRPPYGIITPSFLSREEYSIFFPRRLAPNCTLSWCEHAAHASAKLCACLTSTCIRARPQKIFVTNVSKAARGAEGRGKRQFCSPMFPSVKPQKAQELHT